MFDFSALLNMITDDIQHSDRQLTNVISRWWKRSR
jgi:hypothetical protein